MPLITTQVNNLHPNLEDIDLKETFEPFGFLELVQVARDPATQKSLGYGFVQYREFGDGVKAMQHWNGKERGNKRLTGGPDSWNKSMKCSQPKKPDCSIR